MMSVRLRYQSHLREWELREDKMSDDGESKFLKLARLSINLFNIVKKNEKTVNSVGTSDSIYPLQSWEDEYPVLQQTYY